MSDTPAEVSPVEPLQFDQAEYTAAAPAATCKLCSQPMKDVYYQFNGQAFCPACRERVQQALDSGTGLGRFGRATLYGSLAGLAGAAIYYGVREITGINFGLISILVGLMIGKAVQKGCNARGGWLYQGLAMFLTYTAIVLTYIPPMIEMIRHPPDAAAAQAQPVQAQPAQARPGEPAGAPRASAAEANDAPGSALPGPVKYLIMAVVLIGFAYAIPVLLGFQSLMGLIIVGIGLYEAWVINKRVPLVIGGPFRISPAAEGSVIDAEPVG